MNTCAKFRPHLHKLLFVGYTCIGADFQPNAKVCRKRLAAKHLQAIFVNPYHNESLAEGRCAMLQRGIRVSLQMHLDRREWPNGVRAPA